MTDSWLIYLAGIVMCMLIPVLYIGLNAFLITFHRYLNYKKSRFEKKLLFIVFIITLVISGIIFYKYHSAFILRTNGQTRCTTVYEGELGNSDKIGKIIFAEDGTTDEAMLAVGKFITQKDGTNEYYDVKVANGEITIVGAPKKYSEYLKSTLQSEGYDIQNFSGSTICYDDIEKIAKNNITYFHNEINGSIIASTLYFGFMFSPWIILIIDYNFRNRKRRKKNLLLKTKLEDI